MSLSDDVNEGFFVLHQALTGFFRLACIAIHVTCLWFIDPHEPLGIDIPLLSHLSDYLADLKGRGKTQKHVDLSKARIGRLIKECNWKVFRDVEADDFIRWRNQNLQHTPKTLNDYLASAVSLLNWMEKFGRCPVNPLRHVVKADGRGKLKHGRRAFTDEELQRLLSLDSPNHLAYLLAAGTGLRRGELEQLTWVTLIWRNPRLTSLPEPAPRRTRRKSGFH